jgi:hypothetical protein
MVSKRSKKKSFKLSGHPRKLLTNFFRRNCMLLVKYRWFCVQSWLLGGIKELAFGFVRGQFLTAHLHTYAFMYGRFPSYVKQGKFNVGVHSPSWQPRSFTTKNYFLYLINGGLLALSAGAVTMNFWPIWSSRMHKCRILQVPRFPCWLPESKWVESFPSKSHCFKRSKRFRSLGLKQASRCQSGLPDGLFSNQK